MSENPHLLNYEELKAKIARNREEFDRLGDELFKLSEKERELRVRRGQLSNSLANEERGIAAMEKILAAHRT